MAKVIIKHNPRTEQTWEDLDNYREFCVDYGYKFNESDLYNFRSYAFQQFNKHVKACPCVKKN